MAIPDFRTTFENLQLSETAKNISSFMYYAQGRSIMKGKEHRLVFDLAQHQYWLEERLEERKDNEEGENGIFEKIPGRFGRVFNIPEGIRVEVENAAVQFYADGRIDKVRIYFENLRKNYFTISTKEQSGYVGLYDFKME